MHCIKFLPRLGACINRKKRFVNGEIWPHLKFSRHNSAFSVLDIRENEDFWKKIIYNEVLLKKFVKETTKERPVFLKYVLDEKKKVEENPVEETAENVHFPYEIQRKFLDESDVNGIESVFPESISNFTPSDSEKIKPLKWGQEDCKIDAQNLERPERWAKYYTPYLEDDNLDEEFKFGTSRPDVKVSRVPCGGCGALLHCNDPSVPGFIPAEVFLGKTKTELLAEICQRCHFLKQYQVSLGLNVSPSEYIKIISSIKNTDALAIVMVDLTDFPCSVFPEIFSIIGTDRPVIIVGNKVDLLIQGSPHFMENFKKALLCSLQRQKVKLENIVHLQLISAKTGYGVEDLITKIQLNWGTKGDIYLIGCTNVGKSTLFNTLIRSDLCQVKAINILQRATVSAWPGTTLNLLKFPLKKLSTSRLVSVFHRVKHCKREEKAHKEFQWLGHNVKMEQIPLKEYVYNPGDDSEDGKEKPIGLDYKSRQFATSKWFHDTPGVVHEDQIVNLLTTSELLLTVPKKMLLPRNFRLNPGHSLFIGGLARLDFVSGADNVWFTVFASTELPLTVTKLEDADLVYEKLLGTPLFRVPSKGKQRLSKWPKLSAKEFEVVGRAAKGGYNEVKPSDNRKPSDADIVLSSAGWIAINVPVGYRCKVEAWTPEGRGIYLRDPPLIAEGINFKGRRIPRTPAFSCSLVESEGFSFTEDPPF